MLKKLRSFFKNTKPVYVEKPKKKSTTTFDIDNYKNLNKIEIVHKACKEIELFHSSFFSSKIVFKYIDGMISMDDISKAIYYLKKNNHLKKITVLTSDNYPKCQQLYSLNK
jgi:hypothetical protein